jgi:hypothetical protein
MTTVRLSGHNLPCAGGGYFRLLPYRLFRAGLRRVNRVEGCPGVFYFHPWEVDPAQPRVAGSGWKSRFRHYTNLERMGGRLDRLLRDFAWGRMDEVFADLLSEGGPVISSNLAVDARSRRRNALRFSALQRKRPSA